MPPLGRRNDELWPFGKLGRLENRTNDLRIVGNVVLRRRYVVLREWKTNDEVVEDDRGEQSKSDRLGVGLASAEKFERDGAYEGVGGTRVEKERHRTPTHATRSLR